MFKSKTIGWITALTLLCLAGVALACRLQEGGGPATQAVNWTAPQTEKDAPPALATPALPSEPLPPPIPPLEPMVVPAPVASNPPEPSALPQTTQRATPPPVVAESAAPLAPPTAEKAPEPISQVAVEPSKPLPATPAPETVPAVKVEVTPVAPPKPDPMPTAPEQKVYWAGKGETLRDIARKALGSERRWKELDQLNPTLRAGIVIPSGTMVRLPGDASAAPAGGQAESEVAPPFRTNLKPLPIVRMRKPDSGKNRIPMTGSFECRLDGRYGLTLPKEVCEQLDRCDTILLTPGADRCLWLVTQSSAARVVERIEKAHVDNSDVEGFRRLFFSQSEKCPVEAGSARLEVPAKLAEYAGLDGEVVLVGVEDHFELWNATRWHHYSQQKASMTKPSSAEDE